MARFDECPVWLVIGPPDVNGDPVRVILSGAYSASGMTFTVRRQYSGDVVGRAGGGGYDRQGAALADGLSRVFGLPGFDGARGSYAVVEWAADHGVAVYDLTCALYALPGIDPAYTVGVES